MFKTYKKIQHSGREFSVLALPGSNLFKLEIINDFGADVERLYGPKVGRNVYGMAHLIEHLGFRATKDFPTEQLMAELKANGEYNASTDHNQINYFYKTITPHYKMAIKLACNFTFNDLTGIPEDEYLTERGVVFNEAKRYADDDQTMFHFKISPTVLGRHEEDTIIGVPETINTFTLEDCINMKAIFLKNGKVTYNVTYDPLGVSIETVLTEICDQLDRFPAPTVIETDVSYEEYTQSRNMDGVALKSSVIQNDSVQRLITYIFDVVPPKDTSVTDWANSYVSQYAVGISLNDYIREKNGLTYGLHFYSPEYGDKHFVQFSCDVSRGNEEILLKLFNQSVNECYDTWTVDKYNNYRATKALKTGLYLVNLGGYAFVHSVGREEPELFAKYSELFAENIDVAWDTIVENEFTFEKMRSYMKCLVDTVNCGQYTVVTN